MAKRISEGKCSYCNTTFTKATMTKHLKSCKQRKDALEWTLKDRGTRKTKVFHIAVEGRYLPQYWMHLEAPANAALKDLDDFLRDARVECCGHLSAFIINNVWYERDTGFVGAMGPMIFGKGGPTKNMDILQGYLLRPGLKFHYEYDFGTTTHLNLKVVAEREGRIGEERIQLLARNNPPPITCGSCGKIATQVCAKCIYENKGWLCDKCSRKHECGGDMLLPVVNSPRVGTCGYTG